MTSGIRHLSRKHIDVQKWDQCIRNAGNGLIYPYTCYLDKMADNWDGFVQGDYESVMPVPWRRKWGIKYAYHPPFVQQLGIFGKLSDAIQEKFTQLAFSSFVFGDFFFNYDNNWLAAHRPVNPMTNLVLRLNRNYHDISSQYSKGLTENLNRAERFELKFGPEQDLRKAVNMFSQEYHERTPHVTPSQYESFADLCLELQKTNQAFARKVMDQNGNILSIGLFLSDNRRIYLLMNKTNSEGKKLEANRFLLDNLIREYANQPLILDFEGTDLPGVKWFYENFAPSNQPFFHYRLNRLPWPLSLFKR